MERNWSGINHIGIGIGIKLDLNQIGIRLELDENEISIMIDQIGIEQ